VNTVPTAPIAAAEILTPQELAKRLKVPQSWVYDKQRRHHKDPLPTLHMGRYIRFDFNEVLVWVHRQKRVTR
jgi:hypothetical protein